MRPDAVGALAAHLEREGVSSARIDAVRPSQTAYGVSIAECHAGDGARWYIATDEYGNRFGWADTEPLAVRALAEAEAVAQQRHGRAHV